MDNKAIYIVFTATPYRIGRMIRKVTRESYNHVSIALDEDLTDMYSFARRYYKTPFYGGFVKESIARYHTKGIASNLHMCRIPVTEQQYTAVAQQLQNMLERNEHYLYNHFSAISALFHRQTQVKDAYICVEFCTRVLQAIGIDIDPNKFYSVGDLEKLLQEYSYYTGSMPDTNMYDSEYFSAKPVAHPAIQTARDFFELFRRLKQ